MKKLIFEKFASDIVRAEASKKIMGGYGDEGNASSTSSCTVVTTASWAGTPDTAGDTTSDGDWYPSC